MNIKWKWLLSALLALFAFVIQLPAQQSESEKIHAEEIKAKAEKGDYDAQYELGGLYYGGKGVAQDYAEATKWFEKAAIQKQADEAESRAQQHKLFEEFRADAEKGDASSQCFLGGFYRRGIGVEKDELKAIKWTRKAAEQGWAEAEYDLGVCYRDGIGVTKDVCESVKWWQRAAEQGYAKAEWDFGSCFANGDCVPRDYIEAYKWCNLAAAQGKVMNGGLSFLEARMTPEQVAEAQRLSREFKPRKATVSKNPSSPESPTASGTGFFITEDGYLITNEHVVKDAAQVRLVTSAGLISARVVKVDAANDLALLKAEGRFASLPIAASRTVKLGGTVATVGFPNIGLQGFAPKFARGEIASLSGAGDDARYFQISVPVQPGNSGGALVDERGNVVGVVSAKLNAAAALKSSGALPENVNYAVKSGYLLSFLESVPEVSAKLKEANGKEIKFEEVVEKAKQAAVLVLVY